MDAFGLFRKPAVSRKPVAGTEGHKKVVSAERAPKSYAEKCHEKVEDRKTRRVNISTIRTETKDSVGDCANHNSGEGAKHTLPENRNENPFFHGSTDSAVLEDRKTDEKERKGNAIVTTRFRREHIFDALRNSGTELTVGEDAG